MREDAVRIQSMTTSLSKPRAEVSLRQVAAVPLLRTLERIAKSARFKQSILSPVRVAAEGMLLGLLRREDMDAIVQRTYRSKPSFYDPRRYQLPHEQRMLPKLLSLAGTRKRLLDAFCGQGREAELLARAGFEVTAIDREAWMIESARKYASETETKATFIQAEWSSFNSRKPFQIVYTSLWMLSTFQGADRRQQMLEKCKELCTANGLVVVSTVTDTENSVLAGWIRHSIAKLVGLVSFGNRHCERGERFYGGLFWHHLSDQTARKEFDSAGLRVVDEVPGNGIDPHFYFLVKNDPRYGHDDVR